MGNMLNWAMNDVHNCYIIILYYIIGWTLTIIIIKYCTYTMDIYTYYYWLGSSSLKSLSCSSFIVLYVRILYTTHIAVLREG